MKPTKQFITYLCLSALLSACSSTSVITPSLTASESAKQSSSDAQRFVQLSVPIQATPTQKMYVLNAAKTQQIAYWTTVVNSLPTIAPPYPYFTLALTPGASTTFYLVTPQSTSPTGYIGCSLSFDQHGVINKSANDRCQGVVTRQNENYQHDVLASLVTVFNLGANFGQKIDVNASILSNQVAASAIPRMITFDNKSNFDVCIIDQQGNPDAAPTPSQMCDNAFQTKVLSNTSVDFPIPTSGLNSAAWIVAGYRASGTETWLQSGFVNPNRNQAATKVELTMFPYYPTGTLSGPILNSVGPTNIDISSVDGVNLLYKFYPKQPVAGASGICTLANNNVNPATQYTGVYSAVAPISYFSNADSNDMFSCQSGNTYNSSSSVGCASQCTMAYVNGESSTEINQKCCIGSDGTAVACTASSNPHDPDNSWYTALIHKQFINSYSFAYDDAKADFTCDPFASYVLEIDGVGSSIVNS